MLSLCYLSVVLSSSTSLFIYFKKHIIDLDIVGDGGKVALDRHGELENLDYAEEREEHANNHFQRWNDFIRWLKDWNVP